MGNTVSPTSLIIVESHNDEAFIKLLLSTLGVDNSVELVQFLDLGRTDERPWGKNEKAITDRLSLIKGYLFQPEYGQVQRIGIIIDADTDSFADNLAIVNNSFANGLGASANLTQEGDTKVLTIVSSTGESADIEVSFFLMKGSSGTGYLETVLREIAKGSCHESDCLLEMNNCVKRKKNTAEDMRDMDKQWINYYLRSNLSNKERKKADQLVSTLIEKRGAELFNLDHALLAGLKAYLQQFA